MNFRRPRAALAVGMLVWLTIGHARADLNLQDETVRLNGFGTIGLTHGGDDALGLRRDISRRGQSSDAWDIGTDSVLGLQLDAVLAPNLDATVQVVAKDRTKNGLDQSVEWAFVRYRPGSNLTLRAGRLGVDAFMLSEYRNVGFAYLWARRPMEFYGPNSYGYIDGADVVFSHPWKSGLIRAKLFGGKSREFLARDGTDDFYLDLSLMGTILSWESDRWLARFGYVSTTIDNSAENSKPLIDALNATPSFLWPDASALADSVDSEDKKIQYYSLGIRYDDSPWTVQAEAGYLTSELKGTLPLVTGYLSVGRRVGAVTWYGMAAMAKSPDGRLQAPAAPLPALAPLQQGVQFGYDTSYVNQHSLSFGLRWDMRPDIALKAQWDHHWIAPYGGGLWDQEQPVAERRALDTVSFNLNFVF